MVRVGRNLGRLWNSMDRERNARHLFRTQTPRKDCVEDVEDGVHDPAEDDRRRGT